MTHDSAPLRRVKRASWCVAAVAGLLALCITRIASAEIIPALESEPKQWVWDMGIPYRDEDGQIRLRSGAEEPFGLDFNGLADKWCKTISGKWETLADYERELGHAAPDATSCNQGDPNQNSPLPAPGKICKFGCETRPGYVFNLWITDVPGWSQLRGTYSCPANQNWTLVYASCQRPDCVFGQIRDDADGLCKSPPDDKRRGDTPDELCDGNPVNVGSGDKQQVVDVYRGDVLRLNYSSSKAVVEPVFKGLFGPGWTSVYDTGIHSADDRGAANGPSLVTVRKSRGQLIDFRRQADGTYRADADIRDRLVRLTGSSGTTSGWQLFSADELQVFVFESLPNLWEARVTEIHGIGGNPYTLFYRGNQLISVSRAARFYPFIFSYSGESTQPASVGLPSATVTFRYDANGSGRLSGISWIPVSGATETKSFLYEDGRFPYNLTGIVDENASRFATWSYDASGRAISSEHAGGVEKTTFEYFDTSTISTDPLLTRRTRYLAKVRGVTRGISMSQPGGSGCAPSTSNQAFDANGNLRSRDDFNGNRSCYASDLARNLTAVSVEGLSSSTDCTAVLNAGAALPTGSRKVQTQWHPDWPLPTARAEPLKRTTWVFNGQPDPFNGGSTAMCAPSSALLPDGKPIVVLCRRVEQATADADGSKGFAAAPQAGIPAREERWTYDANGSPLTHKGPRTDVDDTTSFTYYTTNGGHLIGDLATLRNPAGHVTTFAEYNFEGQVTQVVDPAGVRTTLTYDARQRPTSSTTGGLKTAWSYDLTGQLRTLTLPDGVTATYGYDAAHRLTSVRDSLGNSIVYTLDNAGNRIKEEIKDPSGTLLRTVTRSIDALNRVEKLSGARP